MFCGNCKEPLKGATAARHIASCLDPRWKDVVKAKTFGEHDKAARIARRILGVRGPEMDEETKEKLREYARTHAKEIKEKRTRRSLVRRRVREMSRPAAKKAR